MLTTPLFIIATALNAWAVLHFFMAKQSSKGQYKSISYDRLPGIMTPSTLSSREAWMVGHKAPINRELFMFGSLMVGIACTAAIVFKGDRVAARYNQSKVDVAANQ